MAHLTSIELYLQKFVAPGPYANLFVQVYEADPAYQTHPDDTLLLGTTQSVNAGDISTTAGWVSFTFATPVEINGDGYFGFVVDGDDFIAGYGARIYYSNVSDGNSQWFEARTNTPTDWSISPDMPIRLHFSDADDYAHESVWLYESLGEFKFGARVFLSFPPTPPSTPVLSSPADSASGIYLNTDGLLTLSWEDDDAEDISLYTVWFNGVEQTDRSKYFTGSYHMYLPDQLGYNTGYSWFVRKTVDDVDYDSDTWSFTTTVLSPPAYSTRQKTPYGGGDPITVPSGENNQLTIKRLVAAARNKIFYEDV